MKRISLAVILAICVLCSLIPPAYGHGAEEHNRELRWVLFGSPSKNPPNNTEKANTALDRLYNAMYLSIDQFSTGDDITTGITNLAYLKGQKIKWLPRSIKDINYKASPNTHRSFTHMGWNWEYDKPFTAANWPARKMILLSTVNDTFKFKITGNDPDNYKGKCDSFAALIYYVHLIGDHIENKKIKAEGYEMNLGGTRDGINIIIELKHHLEILFADQKSKGTYSSLMNSLDDLNDRMLSLNSQTGGIQYQDYHKCAEDLLKILKSHVWYLLKNEEFFKKVFY